MNAPKNLELAQRFLATLAQQDADAVAAMFADDAQWEVAGDAGALPWIGKRQARDAVISFVRDSATLVERLKLDVHDIVAGERHAVIVGELASRYRANGNVIDTAFAIVLQIADDKITHFRMFEDSYTVSRAVRGGGPACASN